VPRVPGCVPAPVPPTCQAAVAGSKGPPGRGIKLDKLPLFPAATFRAIRARLRRQRDTQPPAASPRDPRPPKPWCPPRMTVLGGRLAGTSRAAVGTAARQAQCYGTGWHGDAAVTDASITQARWAPRAGTERGAAARPVPAAQEPGTVSLGAPHQAPPVPAPCLPGTVIVQLLRGGGCLCFKRPLWKNNPSGRRRRRKEGDHHWPSPQPCGHARAVGTGQRGGTAWRGGTAPLLASSLLQGGWQQAGGRGGAKSPLPQLGWTPWDWASCRVPPVAGQQRASPGHSPRRRARSRFGAQSAWGCPGPGAGRGEAAGPGRRALGRGTALLGVPARIVFQRKQALPEGNL